MNLKTDIYNRCGSIIVWKLAGNQLHGVGLGEEVWTARSGQLTSR